MKGFIKVSVMLMSVAVFIIFFVTPVFAAWTTTKCTIFDPSNGLNISRGQNFNIVIEACASGSTGGYVAPQQYAKYCSGTTCEPLTSISTTGGSNPMNTTTNPISCGNACKNACVNSTFGVTANNGGQFVIGGQCVGNNNLTANRRNITINGLLTANASFVSGGALNATVINGTTDCAASNPTCSHIAFNGTCTVTDGSATNIALYVQDNSSGVWANTTGAVGALIYTNRTVYNISSLSGTSGNMFFNVTVTNKTAEYGLRTQCNGPNVEPSWANSTIETNLSVISAPAADTCTPTEGEDWLLDSDDNCIISNKAYSVKRINVTGSGALFCARCNITYTALSLVRTASMVFNESFIFLRLVI